MEDRDKEGREEEIKEEEEGKKEDTQQEDTATADDTVKMEEEDTPTESKEQATPSNDEVVNDSKEKPDEAGVETEEEEDQEEEEEEEDPLVAGALAAKAEGTVDSWVRYLDETDPSHRLRSLCKKGDLDALRALLSQDGHGGVDINAVSDEGWTCLHEIITHECQFTQVAEVLLAHGADVNTQDLNGDSPLHSALLYHNAANITLLLEAKADLGMLNGGGRTPVHVADAADTLKLLLDAGASVDAQDRVGNTPLHYAVVARDKERVALILKHAPDLTLANRSGSTALHLSGDSDIASRLLACGASPNLPDINANTPLHLAVRGRHKEIVRAMLEHNGDASLANAAGKTPLNLAKDKEMKNILLGKTAAAATPTPTKSTPNAAAAKKQQQASNEFADKFVSLPECNSPSILKKRKRTFSEELESGGTPAKGPRLRFSETNDYSGVEPSRKRHCRAVVKNGTGPIENTMQRISLNDSPQKDLI